MCFAVPGRIILIEKNNKALVDFMGHKKKIDISLVSNVKKGDYIITKNNLALNKIEKREAENIFRIIKKCNHRH